MYVPDGVPELQKYNYTLVNNFYTPTDASDSGVYSIASYLNAINKALEHCLTSAYFSSTRPAAAAPNTVKFTYDGDKFAFEAPAGFGALDIEIWMNDDLRNLLAGFEYLRKPSPNPALGNSRYSLRHKEFMTGTKMTE